MYSTLLLLINALNFIQKAVIQKTEKLHFWRNFYQKEKKSTTNPKAPHDLYDQRDISAFSPGKIKSFRDTNVT